MPRRAPPRLPAGERDRRLGEEVLYLHSLWRHGPDAPAPAPAPIQSRSARREERDLRGLHRVLRARERERLMLYRALHGKERKRRRVDLAAAAAEPAPAPASSRETLAEAAGASAPSTADPPPPATPPGPPAQREAVPSSVDFTNREGSDSDGDKALEQEAAAYFTGLFERDAWLRGHYTERWRKGRFQCMVCAAGGGKPVRRFRGCLALMQHARDASRARCGRYGRRGAHRALADVVCRMLGWDIETLSKPRVVIDPRATSGVQHAKDNGENDGNSTDDDSYSIDDEDEESEDEESEDEEEDVETWMPDPGITGDEDDSEIESNEDDNEKEDRENRMEDSSTDDEDVDELERSKEASQKEDTDTGVEGSKIADGHKEVIELDNSEKIPEKEAANSIARKRDMKIRDRLLRLTHAKPVNTTPKKTEVRKRSGVPKHKEVSTPGSKFNEGSDEAKRKTSALSYQGESSASGSGVVKKVKVSQQPSNKGKQSKTNETGASARKAKRPAVAARKARKLAMKLKKTRKERHRAKKRKVDAPTPENTQEQKASS